MRGDRTGRACERCAAPMILTTSGTQAVCSSYTCSYYERVGETLTVKVKR